MWISERGIALIKKWEGLSLTPYKDAAGNWTIGYGSLISTEEALGYKDGISEKTAEQMLLEDISGAERAVNIYDKDYGFNQNEYDALVSFAYNIGNIKSLTKSGTRTRVRIAAAMPEYCKAGGRRLRGLYNRRMEELALFLEPSNIDDMTYDENKPDETVPFLYKVTIDNLLIRVSPGKEYSHIKDKNGKACYTGKGVFTITEVNNGWGKLKSGLGWISLNSKYGYRLK